MIWPGFEEFWAAYPARCQRRDKGMARIAWSSLCPPLDKVLEALQWQDQSPDWRKDGGAFIPAPAVWINQHRWEREKPVTTPDDSAAGPKRLIAPDGQDVTDLPGWMRVGIPVQER